MWRDFLISLKYIILCLLAALNYKLSILYIFLTKCQDNYNKQQLNNLLFLFVLFKEFLDILLRQEYIALMLNNLLSFKGETNHEELPGSNF